MIGIFMALQLNNWNINRKQKQHYNATLEHLYNAVKKTIWTSQLSEAYITQQIQLIDQLITNPSSIPDNKLLPLIFYVETTSLNINIVETQYNFSLLQNNPENVGQNELSRLISNYISPLENNSTYNPQKPSGLFTSSGIAEPVLTFGLDAMNNFSTLDTTFFNTNEIEKAKFIVQSEMFNTNARSLKSRKQNVLINTGRSQTGGTAILKAIEKFYPEVRLLYNDIGIIGTAISGYDDIEGGVSTPMELINVQESIWKIDLYLKDGTVKFRNADSWINNWGKRLNGESLMYFGENIPVTKGNYQITLNLNEESYEFVKLGED